MKSSWVCQGIIQCSNHSGEYYFEGVNPPTLGRAFHRLKHPQYHARGPAPKIITFIRNYFFLLESEDINLSKECEGMSREVSGHNVQLMFVPGNLLI
jgi:hypothetical protein